MPQYIDSFSDANHGGCLRTRQSSSCSVTMHGQHMIRFSSTTQQPIALSSAESGWYATVKSATIAVGMGNMAADYSKFVQVHLFGDAPVASGIGHRRGAGKVRHLECATLWLQRLITLGKIHMRRRPGSEDMTDIGTKMWLLP